MQSTTSTELRNYIRNIDSSVKALQKLRKQASDQLDLDTSLNEYSDESDSISSPD